MDFILHKAPNGFNFSAEKSSPMKGTLNSIPFWQAKRCVKSYVNCDVLSMSQKPVKRRLSLHVTIEFCKNIQNIWVVLNKQKTTLSHIDTNCDNIKSFLFICREINLQLGFRHIFYLN